MDQLFTFCSTHNTINTVNGNHVVAQRINDLWICDPAPEVPYLIAQKVFQTIYRQHNLKWGDGQKLLLALSQEELVKPEKKYTNNFRDIKFTLNGYTNTIRFCDDDYMAARKLTDHWVCDYDTSIPEKDMLRLFSMIQNNQALRFGTGEELAAALAVEHEAVEQ